VEGLIEVGDEDSVANGEADSQPVAAVVAPAEPALSASAPADAAPPLPAAAVVLPPVGAETTVTPAVGVVSLAAPATPAAPIVVVRPPRPCRIDFEGFSGTEAVKVEVRAWIDRLGDLTAPMTSAEVAIEAVHEPRKDRMYRVRMRLAMRAGVVVVAPDHPNNGAHEDVYCAIRNGFRAARRQLEGYLKEHPAVDAPPPVTGGSPIPDGSAG